MIATSIDGKKLKFYFNPSPVGDAKYVGPKLELMDSRTNFEYGDYCDASAPSTIPPDGFGDIIVGDSYWGLASAVRMCTSFTFFLCFSCISSDHHLSFQNFQLGFYFSRRCHRKRISTTRSINLMDLLQPAC